MWFITMHIKIHIKTIDFVPVPNHMIIIGPRAILGKEFKTTINGSKIFLKVSLAHKSMAKKVPRTVLK